MKVLIMLIGCFLLQSCIYYPLMHYSMDQNVPLITEKGEGQFSIARGTEPLGFQGALGITNSISVMGSFSNGLNDVIGDGDGMGIVAVDNGSRQSSELAVGYHFSSHPQVLFEIYGGADRYQRSFSYSTYYPQFSESFSTNITKPFVQFDAGLLTKKNNGLGLSCKFGALIFDHYSDIKAGMNNVGNYPLNNSMEAIIEPCITYRFGIKNVSIQLQMGTDFTPNDPYLLSSEAYVSAGIQFRLYNLLKSGSNKNDLSN